MFGINQILTPVASILSTVSINLILFYLKQKTDKKIQEGESCTEFSTALLRVFQS